MYTKELWPVCLKRIKIACMSPTGENLHLLNPVAKSHCCLKHKSSVCHTTTSCSKEFNMNCDDTFPAGHDCGVSNRWSYKIYSFIEYVTRKQMDFLTLKANQLYKEELYILLISSDPECSHCPSRNSCSIECGQGRVVSVVVQKLLNSS